VKFAAGNFLYDTYILVSLTMYVLPLLT